MTTTTKQIDSYVYFIVSVGICHQYIVRYGRVENRMTVQGTEWFDVRPLDEHNRIYKLSKENTFASLDEAKHKAISLIESNAITAKSVLETSVKLLKHN